MNYDIDFFIASHLYSVLYLEIIQKYGFSGNILRNFSKLFTKGDMNVIEKEFISSKLIGSLMIASLLRDFNILIKYIKHISIHNTPMNPVQFLYFIIEEIDA